MASLEWYGIKLNVSNRPGEKKPLSIWRGRKNWLVIDNNLVYFGRTNKAVIQNNHFSERLRNCSSKRCLQKDEYLKQRSKGRSNVDL